MFKASLRSVSALIAAVGLAYYLYPVSQRTEVNSDLTSLHNRSKSFSLDNPTAAVERFAGTLRFRTVSSRTAENHAQHPQDFRDLHKYLRKEWPLPFQSLEVTVVKELSLLLKWQGTDRSAKPILCISHLDTVDVASESKWSHPPYSGAIDGGYVWGRGALDLKISIAALLEAVSYHLSHGLVPARTIYFAFGHDEEVGGGLGASSIAKLLGSQGIEFEHILDEGGSVLIDGLKGLTKTPVGLVGIAEKAVQNIEVQVHGKGGHTMAPPHDGSSVTARLARILNKVETSYPAPKLVAPTSDLLRTAGGAADSLLIRLLLSNCEIWPLSWLLARVLAWKDSELGSAMRTTAITTDIQLLPPGRNVIPSLAKAHLSFRLLPNDHPERIRKQLMDFAASEEKHGEITFSELDYVKLSPVSSSDSLGFQIIQQAAMETLQSPKGLVMTPYLMLGRTDSTNYAHLSGGNIFRFAPFPVNRTSGDLQRIHGIDERIGTLAYLDCVTFYIRYLQLATDPTKLK